jgi:hypothetical protein
MLIGMTAELSHFKLMFKLTSVGATGLTSLTFSKACNVNEAKSLSDDCSDATILTPKVSHPIRHLF